jgi:ubiquinone/menaquinone biosynthesis C-methylase UbiE
MESNGELQVQNNSAKYYEERRYVGTGLFYHSSVIDGLMDGISGTILDLGCGTGIISKLYPSKDIVGIDISPEMLKYHPGKFLQASAEDIPFESFTFDSVICRSVIHHLQRPKLALNEIRRVLKQGGKVVFWETNKSAIASFIRGITQHGDRFSEYHTQFDNFQDLVSCFFNVKEIKYQGFFAYPLLGFPDIIDFSFFSKYFKKQLISLDNLLSNTPFKKLSFAIMVKAIK